MYQVQRSSGDTCMVGTSHASTRRAGGSITDRDQRPANVRVFISYRRTEDAWPANSLYGHLREHFSETEIFRDVDSIDLGDDFVSAIIAAVESCDVLLVVIGPSWLTLTDGEGNRRLDDPDDFVRIEIETALLREIRVIPILIDGAVMPTARQLPPSLAKLGRRQALELAAGRFMLDAMRLVKVIKNEITESQARQQARSRPPRNAADNSAYNQAISRKDPGCIIILLDRSDSMGKLWDGKETLAQGAARAINDMLMELCLRASTFDGVRHYFDIGVFGYGKCTFAGGEGVESAFGGALASQALASLPDISSNPLAIREIASPGYGSPTIRTPIWVEPAHGHRRPMCQAIAMAGQHAYEWAQAHQASFPPIVINITNGAATDSPYEGASLDLWAQRLTSISTQDGPALFFNVFLSGAPGSAMFPAADGELPAPGPELFRISSRLPPPMAAYANATGDTPPPDARGLLLNVDCTMLVRFLGIGTSIGMFR